MWWARQESNLRSEAVSFVAAIICSVSPAGSIHYHFTLDEKKPIRRLVYFCFSANVVGAAGVEPATAWFVARYSIQLSYAPTLNFIYYLVQR